MSCHYLDRKTESTILSLFSSFAVQLYFVFLLLVNHFDLAILKIAHKLFHKAWAPLV